MKIRRGVYRREDPVDDHPRTGTSLPVGWRAAWLTTDSFFQVLDCNLNLLHYPLIFLDTWTSCGSASPTLKHQRGVVQLNREVLLTIEVEATPQQSWQAKQCRLDFERPTKDSRIFIMPARRTWTTTCKVLLLCTARKGYLEEKVPCWKFGAPKRGYHLHRRPRRGIQRKRMWICRRKVLPSRQIPRIYHGLAPSPWPLHPNMLSPFMRWQ